MEKTVSVALSGSGFLLGCHVGAFACLSDNGFVIKELVGTSGGAIVSSLIACGYNSDLIRHIMITADFSKFMSYKIWIFGWKDGLSSGDNLYKWLLEITHGMTFRETNIPIKMIATDITNGVPFVFSKETTPDVTLALGARASASLPVLYNSVYFDTETCAVENGIGDNVIELQDGGICCDLATNYLTGDYVKIGFEIMHKFKPLDENSGYLDKFGRIISMFIGENEELSTYMAKNAIIVEIPSMGISSLDKTMSIDIKNILYLSGYTAMSKKVNLIL